MADLSGTYPNELRSVMVLRQDSDNNLSGTYHSLVGRDPGFRAIQGRTADADGAWQMAAFTVCFEINDDERGIYHAICA